MTYIVYVTAHDVIFSNVQLFGTSVVLQGYLDSERFTPVRSTEYFYVKALMSLENRRHGAKFKEASFSVRQLVQLANIWF